jgi:phosphoribosylanthranilate isomerase
MVTKEFEMFYFDDKTFVSLCKQLEKELKTMTLFTGDNAHDLRLAYQKFELFLTVYHHSRKREDIDYKTETRMEIASEINHMSEGNEEAEITEDYRSEHFLNAKEKLERVMEDLIYQITMRNLAPNSADNIEEEI